MQTQPQVLDQQAHFINFKRQQIENKAGIRQIILRRNRLGDDFAQMLQKTLYSDKYIKVMDLAGNKISQFGLKFVLKLGLLEN
jgi:Ran GTPase-activating protein (RanGAP) involved in mRNA processing and transport